MGEDEREGEPTVSQSERGPDEIRQEIEETREELGATVNALSQKADVPAIARDKVSGIKDSVSDIKDTISAKADDVKDKAQTSSPDALDLEQARAMALQGVAAAQQNPAGLAGGAFFLGLLIGRRMGRRSAWRRVTRIVSGRRR